MDCNCGCITLLLRSPRLPPSSHSGTSADGVWPPWRDARATARKDPLDAPAREARAGTPSGVQRVIWDLPGGLRCAETPGYCLSGLRPDRTRGLEVESATGLECIVFVENSVLKTV